MGRPAGSLEDDVARFDGDFVSGGNKVGPGSFLLIRRDVIGYGYSM